MATFQGRDDVVPQLIKLLQEQNAAGVTNGKFRGAEPFGVLTVKALMNLQAGSAAGGGGGGGTGAAPTVASYANSTGNTTITFPAGSSIHTANVAVTGSAGPRIFILDDEDAGGSALASGSLLRINFALPATASIVNAIHNATAGGTLLATLTTDASGDNLALDITFQSGAWVEASVSYLYPSN